MTIAIYVYGSVRTKELRMKKKIRNIHCPKCMTKLRLNDKECPYCKATINEKTSMLKKKDLDSLKEL